MPDKDLNLDQQIQSLLCYHYTIGQFEKLGNTNSSGEFLLQIYSVLTACGKR